MTPTPGRRYPTLAPLSPAELSVAGLIGRGLTSDVICVRLKITSLTYRTYVRQIAAKLPGDLPQQMRILLWWRGFDRKHLFR